MKLDDIIKTPNKGIILNGTNIELDKQDHTNLKSLIGSKIQVDKVDGTKCELDVLDISISFSIANLPLIGISVQDSGNIKDKKGNTSSTITVDLYYSAIFIKKIKFNSKSGVCESHAPLLIL